MDLLEWYIYRYILCSSNSLFDCLFLLQIIGQEFTHGFDPTGKFYDEFGQYIDGGVWNDNETLAFEEKSMCFADQVKIKNQNDYICEVKYKLTSLFLFDIQYSEWDYPQHPVPGTKNFGLLTLQENIADNGGIRLAYDAYQKYIKANGTDVKIIVETCFNCIFMYKYKKFLPPSICFLMCPGIKKNSFSLDLVEHFARCTHPWQLN